LMLKVVKSIFFISTGISSISLEYSKVDFDTYKRFFFKQFSSSTHICICT
jgi:hypothetical protein